jgi:hypothetical protein
MILRYEYDVLIYVKNVYKNKGLFSTWKGVVMERVRHMYANMSDVARLRCQIIQEMEAMRQVFEGFVAGNARHEFIHARMQNIHGHQERLAEHIGKDDAVTTVCELYIRTISTMEGSVCAGVNEP